MIFPNTIESKLGFDQVKNLLAGYCHGPGKQIAENWAISSEFEDIQIKLKRSEEIIKLTSGEEAYPQGHYLDLYKNVIRLNTTGTYLESGELRELANLLHFSSSWYRFFKKRSESYPALTLQAIQLQNFGELVREINLLVDDAGNVKDSASPELSKIRSELNTEQRHLRKALDKTMRWGLNEGYIAEDMTITIRNGRMVVPVKAEHKRKLKGFIHDESSTGQIVFLEPQHALESNNRIKELEFEEKREVIRLLMNMSNILRNYLTPILGANQYLMEMDFLLAISTFASHYACIIPELNKEGEINMLDGRNIGLQVSLESQKRKIIPLTVTLNREKRVLVISGPNAGGKSVALKTVGLVQYMLQSGLPVPVKEGSKFPVFNHLIVDIGDEQSIESDLSTYSSHLNNMRQFVRIADKNTLFLIDEFGSGTEPEMGGAIAAAILETLHDSAALGVITTHYGILKNLSNDFEGLLNGAMRFDTEHLRPLFELEIGVPGSSYALEVAAASRIDHAILEKAKKYVNPDKIRSNELIVELERQRNRYNDLVAKAEANEKYYQDQLTLYKKLTRELENSKKEVLNKAKEEASILLAQTNQRIERTIREIKEKQADKEATKVARKELRAFEEVIQPKQKKAPPKPQKVSGELRENDYVVLDNGNSTGQVISLMDKEAIVSFGELKTTVNLHRLTKVGSPQKQAQTGKKKTSYDVTKRKSVFREELDVRGKMPSEALEITRKIVDEALLVGAGRLRIVHGKGTGVLRDLIRKELKGYPQIASIQDGSYEDGGDGVTLVRFSN